MGQISSGIPVSRSGSSAGGTNNLPPLLFHNVHGDNIRVSRDGMVARRVESFCKGIAFSARPVKPNEKVCIKFLEISNNWSGVIRFGFTYNDPSTLRYGLPKYACPDLTNKPGYWAKALPERFCSQSTTLFYYVTTAGDVHFGINGEEKGIFFSGVETRGPLWALIDVYGNSTAIEFVDIRHHLNNTRRSAASDNTPDEIDRIVYPMHSLSVHHREGEDIFPALRHQNPPMTHHPFPLHRTRGRNVRLNTNRSVATRVDTEFCQGYVFTARPLQIGERIIVQILSMDAMFQGCLSLGLTSCDPATLQPSDLPDDSNFLLDRPEYWVISRNFARNLNVGDEISFCISANGEVQIRRNGAAPCVIIHVDQTLKLWAFLDVYGSTRRVRVLSSIPTAPLATPVRPAESRAVIHANSESMNSLNSQSELRRSSVAHAQNSQNRICCMSPADIQVQPAANGGAVLSVLLPPGHASLIGQQQQALQQQHHSSQSSVQSQNSHASHYSGSVIAPVPLPMSPVGQNGGPAIVATSTGTQAVTSSGTIMSTCSSTYIEPIVATQSWVDGTVGGGAAPHLGGAGTECTICYENPIDAVLYMCGHMCMCYECALQQWRGKGGGHCPLCRALIRDVIRTYKS